MRCPHSEGRAPGRAVSTTTAATRHCGHLDSLIRFEQWHAAWTHAIGFGVDRKMRNFRGRCSRRQFPVPRPHANNHAKCIYSSLSAVMATACASEHVDSQLVTHALGDTMRPPPTTHQRASSCGQGLDLDLLGPPCTVRHLRPRLRSRLFHAWCRSAPPPPSTHCVCAAAPCAVPYLLATACSSCASAAVALCSDRITCLHACSCACVSIPLCKSVGATGLPCTPPGGGLCVCVQMSGLHPRLSA
jgi:hypothetical protein